MRTLPGEVASPRKGRFEVPEIRIKLEEDGFRLLETEADLKERLYHFVAKNPECSMRDIYEGVEARDRDLTKARDALLKEGRLGNRGDGKTHRYVALKSVL